MGDFPSSDLFAHVCRNGLSTVRPLHPSAASDDKWGWNYGSTRPPSYWAYGRLRALLALNIAKALQPKRVLEIAAGDAALCACLAASGCEVVANDLRRENLESSVAHFANRDQIKLLPGNFLDLDPATTNTFDLVVACEIIEHVADAVGMLRQLRRFMTPDGRLLLTTPNGAYFRNELPTYSDIEDFRTLESRQFKPDADGHLYLITPQEMYQIAEKAGLEIQRLVLWGTPFISGGSGFRVLSRLPVPFYRLEMACQHLSEPLKARWCSSMTAILTMKR